MEKTKKRDINFELLRILCMFMIVVWHYNTHGGALYNTELLNFILASTTQAFCAVAVNCFVLITGYYLVIKKFKFEKIFRLWCKVFFYSFTIFVIFIILGKTNISDANTLRSILPIINNNYWFITAYFVLYLTFPFLNILIKNISKSQYIYLLVILSIFLIFVNNFSPFEDSIFNINRGGSYIWFVFLYLLAGYIRLYYKDKENKYSYLLIYIICCILSASSNMIIQILSYRYDFLKTYIGISYNNATVCSALGAIMLFLFFKNIDIKNKKFDNMIITVSSTTLGIYLIHDNPYVCSVLWKNILHTDKFYSSPIYIIHLIVSSVSIFVVCSLISYFVNKLLTKFKFKKTNRLDKLDNMLNSNL